MTFRLSTLALAMSLASAVAAQTPAPDSTTTIRDVTAPSPMSSDRPSTQDPRVCLEFPTSEQVIACAERYRPRRPAAKA